MKVHQIQGMADKNGKHMHRMLRRSKENDQERGRTFSQRSPPYACQIVRAIILLPESFSSTHDSLTTAAKFAHVDISPYIMLYRCQADKA